MREILGNIREFAINKIAAQAINTPATGVFIE
jgi:hypothetical protein